MVEKKEDKAEDRPSEGSDCPAVRLQTQKTQRAAQDAPVQVTAQASVQKVTPSFEFSSLAPECPSCCCLIEKPGDLLIASCSWDNKTHK